MKVSLLVLSILSLLFILPGCGQSQDGQGYLIVKKEQAVSPQYQAKPVRISCPSTVASEANLCREATAFVASGQELGSTKMMCAPGSPSWTLSGQLDGETVSARFDCNTFGSESLEKSVEAVAATGQQ